MIEDCFCKMWEGMERKEAVVRISNCIQFNKYLVLSMCYVDKTKINAKTDTVSDYNNLWSSRGSS